MDSISSRQPRNSSDKNEPFLSQELGTVLGSVLRLLVARPKHYKAFRHVETLFSQGRNFVPSRPAIGWRKVNKPCQPITRFLPWTRIKFPQVEKLSSYPAQKLSSGPTRQLTASQASIHSLQTSMASDRQWMGHWNSSQQTRHDTLPVLRSVSLQPIRMHQIIIIIQY